MKQMPTAFLPIPELHVADDSHVSSAQFGDVYFSRASGAEETRHVFLAGNGLPDRWRGRADFTIGELGFGTGLNFLVAWKEFLNQPDGHLHYISVEKFPLTREQLATLHPELAAIYPLRLPGWHRVHLERCTLTLGFGDALELFRGTDAQIDAWFLDGFSPAKNPDMWSDELFTEIARLSVSDATVATFTAAGFVKRGLAANGFAMEKVRGFAHKRDMLRGERVRRVAEGEPLAAGVSPAELGEGGASPPSINPITIIGAGIAGCTLARRLADAGMNVTVLEKGTVAGGASGNPAAVLYPQLTKFYTPATAWHLAGYGYMLRQLGHWKQQGLNFRWQQPGMVRMPRDGGAQQQLESLQLDPAIARYITQEEASAKVGHRVASDAAFLPEGSWIDPGELCRELLRHPNITLREGTEVTSLPEGITVLCNADAAAGLLPDITMPMGRSAGQVSILPAALKLKTIVSHRGYVIPDGERCIVGATYDRSDYSCAVTEANHQENIQHAHDALPDWKGDAVIGGRTSIRATTPERLPYVGKVREDVYVSIGHGSRGMISAPLAAEIIASQILGEMIPLTPELRTAIHPLRRANASP